MFALRSGSGSSSPSAGASREAPPSVETLRRQARRRLIGAAVLVLAAVFILPAVLEHEPRPLPEDVIIDIPARDAVPALASPTAAPDAATRTTDAGNVDGTTAAQGPSADARGAAPSSGAPAGTVREQLSSAVAPAAAAQPAAGAAAQGAGAVGGAASGAPAASGPTPAAAERATDAAKVRVVVQVGAFAEAARAQEVRQRLERAGLKTYTHVAETPQGKRIRVRVGPFDSRAEAERVAEKVKALGLPAAILTL
ncbi:SPOR domain-containing protein [Tepidimonas charontis]|uniref:Cell division protein FtsN n=1 Tax=Tepidimonas charontis TaxID=2267262 RepID=A0A554XF33_9BURK|nr:SPOR domain-containing protein [Tepidimonas charontis]TSE34435.1 Cell division protein FtsN [Tepidimonas charontis]